jgi:TPR repeat protein
VRDYAKAREWYEKAADAGNNLAMSNLGVLYANGRGVTQDDGKARELFQKAADAGNTNAKKALTELASKSRSKSQASAYHSTYRSTPTKSRQFKGPLVLTPWGLKLRTANAVKELFPIIHYCL